MRRHAVADDVYRGCGRGGVSGGPATVAAQACNCGCPNQPGSLTRSNPAAGGNVPSNLSEANVNYADGVVQLAGFENGAALALDHGKPVLRRGDKILFGTSVPLKPGQWTWLAVSVEEGQAAIWLDGTQIAMCTTAGKDVFYTATIPASPTGTSFFRPNGFVTGVDYVF